jgi:putative ABC transport system permease protein
LADEAEVNGNARVVYFLLVIAGFILIIAWINYINLSTARSMERGREVGVRKTLGAFQPQLIKQFLFESLLVNLLAITIACGLVSLLLPVFNELAGLQFFLGTFWSQSWLWSLLAGLFLVSSLLSGLYPALVLASFRPALVLKGNLRTTKHGILLRQTLVVFQFAAAIALIAGTAIVYLQVQYMLKEDLGFNMEQTLVLERPSIQPEDEDVQKNQYEQFKNELLRSSAIQQVSGVSYIMGSSRTFKYTFRKYGERAEEAQPIRINGVDYNFFAMFKMDLLAGRAFSKEHTTDLDTAIVITESAVKMLGFNHVREAIGSTLTFKGLDSQDNHRVIIGVVNDFHQASLKEAAEPLIFFPSSSGSEYVTMKVSPQDLPRTIEFVQATWNKVFPGNPFSYFFLDDYFNRQYQMDQRFSQLIRIFTVLALFIAGLGLLALSAFAVQQRTKEIGIRKVLGASASSIMLLLSRDFIRPIVIAIVVAVPLTYFVMNQWLNSYASRIQIGAEVFIVTGLFALLVAWLTVSWQAIKAASANPVNSLRKE